MSEESSLVGKIIKITSKYRDKKKIVLVGDINESGSECGQGCCNALDNARYEVVGRVYSIEELINIFENDQDCPLYNTRAFIEWLKERNK